MNSEELRESYGVVLSPEDEVAHLKRRIGQQNSYERVREFHETFGHPVADEPTSVEDNRTTLRLALIIEEVLELADAMGFYTQEVREYTHKMLSHGPVVDGNLVAIADALGDIEYVVNGAALEHGIDLPEVVKEIHRSNMTKLGPDGKPIYREDGKILKSSSYEPPRLK